jgi:hypothetical protein
MLTSPPEVTSRPPARATARAFSASGAQAEGPFREDGYFNMTKAANHFGKQLSNFWLSSETKAYVAAMEQTLGIKVWSATRGALRVMRE